MDDSDMCKCMNDNLDFILQCLTGMADIGLYDYQKCTAKELVKGRNVLLNVPTGCGKTWSVILPFLVPDYWQNPPHRLIYVLPLRTLIESIADLLRETLPRIDGWAPHHIRVQTGADDEDPFFSEARIVVTTFDQLLSGLLGRPYGQGPSLHNINSAAMAGCLVVFDEFHLMESDKAFMTALAGCRMFSEICQSVWMTATATTPLCAELINNLDTVAIKLTDNDKSHIKALNVEKPIFMHHNQINASDIIEKHGKRLVVVNQVRRAQKLYRDVINRIGNSIPVVLLHSRFFSNDRTENQENILQLFGKSSEIVDGIVIATQVVEAGLDISADFLLTEIAPANSIVQRAGRCARYGGYGEVHIYALPEDENKPWLPYGTSKTEDETMSRTKNELLQQDSLLFNDAADLVERVHKHIDEGAIALGVNERLQILYSNILQNNILKNPVAITNLIREEDLSVNLIIAETSVIDDDEIREPWRYEGIKLTVNSLRKLKYDCPDADLWHWTYSTDGNGYWKRCNDQLELAFYYRVSPGFARYTKDCGLELGERGDHVSPDRIVMDRPGHFSTSRESWVNHTISVRQHAIKRFMSEANVTDCKEGLLMAGFRHRYRIDAEMLYKAIEFIALAHDLGKLQKGWQIWAEKVERSVDSSFRLLCPLAHTSTHSESVKNSKPRHALQGAYLACKLLEENKEMFRSLYNPTLMAAMILVILSHHGGWIYSPSQLQPLNQFADNAIKEVFSVSIPNIHENEMNTIMDSLYRRTKSSDFVMEFWPIVAYLTRILRLSDQTATAEGGEGSND